MRYQRSRSLHHPYHRKGIFGLGDAGSKRQIVRKKKGGVTYCALVPEHQEALTNLDRVVEFVPLDEDDLSLLRKHTGISSFPPGTVKMVPIQNGAPTISMAVTVHKAKENGDGLIVYSLPNQITAIVPTQDLDLLKRIDTCHDGSDYTAAVFLEPEGGFVSGSKMALYIAAGAGALVIGGLIYLAIED